MTYHKIRHGLSFAKVNIWLIHCILFIVIKIVMSIRGQIITKLTRFQYEALIKELRQEAAEPQLECLLALGVRDHPTHEIGLLKDFCSVKYHTTFKKHHLGNPLLIFEIRCQPEGTVIGSRSRWVPTPEGNPDRCGSAKSRCARLGRANPSRPHLQPHKVLV